MIDQTSAPRILLRNQAQLLLSEVNGGPAVRARAPEQEDLEGGTHACKLSGRLYDAGNVLNLFPDATHGLTPTLGRRMPRVH